MSLHSRSGDLSRGGDAVSILRKRPGAPHIALSARRSCPMWLTKLSGVDRSEDTVSASTKHSRRASISRCQHQIEHHKRQEPLLSPYNAPALLILFEPEKRDFPVICHRPKRTRKIRHPVGETDRARQQQGHVFGRIARSTTNPSPDRCIHARYMRILDATVVNPPRNC